MTWKEFKDYVDEQLEIMNVSCHARVRDIDVWVDDNAADLDVVFDGEDIYVN